LVKATWIDGILCNDSKQTGPWCKLPHRNLAHLWSQFLH
jgi:hypothetical protein